MKSSSRHVGDLIAELRYDKLASSDSTMKPQSLSGFTGQKYLNLESYRRNGLAVLTPMWFVESDGLIYVYSLANAAKVKRIRNNRRVRIAPCDFRGQLKGDWVAGTATILDEAASLTPQAMLTKKYGWMKRIGDLTSGWRKRARVTMAIRPE